MAEVDNAQLGSWRDDDLEKTAAEHVGTGSDSDLPELPRFSAGIAKLILARLRETKSSGDVDPKQPSFFLLCPSPPPNIRDCTTRVPFVSNGQKVLANRLWFTSEAANSGFFIELPDTDDDGRLKYVEDDLSLGDTPVIVLDPRPSSTEVWMYPKGFKALDNRRKVSLFASDINPDSVFKTIQDVYDEALKVPRLSTMYPLWENGSKYYSSSNPEKIVQYHVRMGIALQFGAATVREEQPQKEGRTDLEIWSMNFDAPGENFLHAILELKVVKSFGSGGSPESESDSQVKVTEGVVQAIAYKAGKNPEWSALCCFDMKKEDQGDDKCFIHVLEKASAAKIRLKRWYLYSTAKRYRDSIA